MFQPGEQIGPFVIEKDIGAGAMGAVYRGTYPKTGQKVAIKIMLPGAAENKNSAERFRREIEILKQFAHPNIVRILGDGKYNGQRFYAMEYIQGEGLDRVMSRRGRISWEEIVQLGQQLCGALQHAHEKGVIHRDLKPSNLMILSDGTLKLTDFGIAKDLDVTQLTEANCTVGTASYMSPEQCRGDRDLTHKSDLYSLGVVFYELLTGRKPFLAENVMDMFMLHVKGVPERPSRLVDVPKWLDVLIVQLLEKKPEQRPRDAAMVSQALADVMEKVEAGQSAGVEAVQSRRPGEKRDESDREAARALAGKKKKIKKPAPRGPWYQSVWLKVIGLLLPLILIVFLIWLALRPPSAEKIYARIERLMKTGELEKMDQARKPIQDYLRHYGKRDDERTRQVREWDDLATVMLAEDDLLKTADKTKSFKLESMDALNDAKKQAVLAVLAENEGELGKAKKLWEEIAREHGADLGDWGQLPRRHLAQLGSFEPIVKELQKIQDNMDRFIQEPTIDDELTRKAFTARRYENLGDRPEAYKRWDELKTELQKNFDRRAWYLLAASRAAEIKAPTPQEEKDRVEVVKKKLAEAKTLREANNLKESELLCLHLIALYTDHPPKSEFGPLAKQAKELYDDILKVTGRKPK